MQDPESTQLPSSEEFTQETPPSEQVTQPTLPIEGYPAPPSSSYPADYHYGNQPPTYQQQPPPPQGPARQSRKTRAPRRRSRRGCMPTPGCLIGCFGVVAAFGLVFLIAGFLIYYQLSQRVDERVKDLEASFNNVDDPNTETGFESTFIYDRHGNRLWEIFGQGRRQRVLLAEIPDSVIQATVSVEDDDFYSNPGFDVKSSVRAVGQYFQQGQVVSGASTITQQLVRNVVFDPQYRSERSINRKLEEIMLAGVLTQRKSKDEILELYLNTIYYGNLAYGIESASQTYFGKSAKDLELHEAALLAGLPQLPAIVDPLNPDPDIQAQVIARQYLVLELMEKEGYITDEEAETAKQQSLNYVSPEVPLEAPHFTLYAMTQLENLMASLGKSPEFIADGGLKVYTTVDLDFQAIAQRSAEQTVDQLRDQHNLTNAAVVIIHPPSGEILAMVGSVDYNNEAIDGQVNVSIAMRQPGSTLKPFTYASAMERGWTPGTIIWDVPTSWGIPGQPAYEPKNYDSRFHGALYPRDALANSYNIPAVKSLDFVGVDYLLSFLRRMGTLSLSDDASRYGLSLTLGGGEITLLEQTSNYATLARGGMYVPTQAILCVIDKNDNIIYQYENRCPEGNLTNQTRNEFVRGTPVLDPRIAFIISDILSDNAARTPAMGANSPLNTGALLTSVKTGTTDSFRDNWTVGFTHDLAVGVWSGNSDNAPMVDISGLAGAAPIWNGVVTEIYRRFEMPPSTLPAPAGVSQRQVCNVRSMRDPSTSCDVRVEWFLDSAPLVPDGQGNLVPYDTGQNQPPPAPSEFGPQLIEHQPGIYEVAVRPLDDLQKSVATSQNPNLYATPIYCMVPIEVLNMVPDVRNQLFIAPPDTPDWQRGAYQYATNNGIPILPQLPCTAETINAFGPVAAGVVGQIVAPQPGQTVSGDIPIYGVVNYPDGVFFDYYKVEVRGGPFPDWTTMGDVHHNEVLEPTVLETFFASALPPGAYEIRLYLQGDLYFEPYVVPINLVSP